MESLLKKQKLPMGKTMLLRIHHPGMSFLEVNHKLVLGAFDEIARKISFVAAGVDTFTDSEKLLFQLLLAHCENGY